jgi:CheY-like chemotaxis protein
MTPATAEEIYKVFQNVYITGKPSESLEWETIRPDGEKRYLEISASLMKNSEGQPSGFRGIARDVTRQRLDREEKERLEGRLQQSQKMEAIGTLAGGIAHDFNNILTSIIGYAELALSIVEKGSMQEDNIKEVIKAGSRATELVRQILAFSRQSAQELKPIMPSHIIKEAIKLLRSATPTTIDVKQNIKSDSLVMGDQTRIHQVLMNLCRQMLAGLGYTVTTRTSSIEALELFRNRPDDFDLVLTDMTMPNMTGDRLAGELMKIRPDIPVILCTGYSKKLSEENVAKIGIKAFVMKPFVRSELAKTIRKVLDNL